MEYSPPFCDFVFVASKTFPLVGVYLFLDTLNPNDVFSLRMRREVSFGVYITLVLWVNHDS